MALHKLRSFMPPALTQLLEGLSRMGYKPREEICLGLLGQARRHMHAASPAQLAVMLHSIAAYGTWRPYRQFLFDFVSHSRLRLGSWSAAEAGNVLWAMATFKWVSCRAVMGVQTRVHVQPAVLRAVLRGACWMADAAGVRVRALAVSVSTLVLLPMCAAAHVCAAVLLPMCVRLPMCAAVCCCPCVLLPMCAAAHVCCCPCVLLPMCVGSDTFSTSTSGVTTF
jgi:hypothetical protein